MTEPRTINKIVIHSTKTASDWMVTNTVQEVYEELERVEKAAGKSELGYNIVIHRNGDWALARSTQPDTVGDDANALAICMVGGESGSDSSGIRDIYTAEQEQSLRKLINEYKSTYTDISAVSGHEARFNVADWV